MTRRKLLLSGSLALLCLLLPGSVLLFRAHGTKRDLESWRNYQEAARARGEDLGIEAWLPPTVADADNLFTHPWIVGFLAGESSPQAEAVAALQEWPGLGLDGYLSCVMEDDEIAKSWFEDKPEERDRVLAAGREHAADFAAIHEAAARPRSRADLDLSKGYEFDSKSWGSLSDIGPMLGIHADAALSAGDEAIAVTDLEAMLRLGAHFRGQNFLLSEVVGAGMEARALSVIEAGATKKAFSPESKQRLRAARRSRKIEEEIAATWRVERGMYLKTLDKFVAKVPRQGLRQNLSAFFYQPERLVATNSLFLCETLDPALSPPSVAGWQDFDRRRNLIRGAGRPEDPDALARATFELTGGIVDSLLAQEEEIDRVFKLLDP